MSLKLCTCVLFMSLMQLVKRAQFLNIPFLFLLFGVAAVPVFEMVVVPLLRRTYLSLQSHEMDFSTEVSHWLWLYNLTCESSSSSTQVFALNLDGPFDVLSKKKSLFFNIALLYCYVNVPSLITCYVFQKMYFFLLLFLYQILHFLFPFPLFLNCSAVNFSRLL